MSGLHNNGMNLEDRAQEQEAQLWEMVNRPREVKTYSPGDPGYGPEECDKCGDDMHPVRRGHGYRLCTPCQSAVEIATQRR